MNKCEKIPASGLSAKLGGNTYDMLFASAGYEKRCLTVPEHLDRGLFKRAHVASYANNAYNEPNWTSVCNLLGNDSVRIEMHSSKPLVGADNFARVLSGIPAGEPPKILLDITAFTRESLIIIVGLLRRLVLVHGARVTCLYSVAGSYAGADDISRRWLSRGIADIRSVLGFPGDMRPSRQNHLIILPGAEEERAWSVVESYEPDLISVGMGQGTHGKDKTLKVIHESLLSRLRAVYSPHRVLEFPLSSYDPFEASEAIVKHVQSKAAYNTIVAPMHTKLSSVGAAMACFRNIDIQLCYAEPKEYNISEYSTPSDDIYVFDLDLGSLESPGVDAVPKT